MGIATGVGAMTRRLVGCLGVVGVLVAVTLGVLAVAWDAALARRDDV